MNDFSVIVCTHNPRLDYLTRVLTALKKQTLSFDQWELLVIDNASSEPISQWIDVSWHPSGRVMREEELGLTPARLRGIREASGALLVFVDDDNVLDASYLAKARMIQAQFPQLGCFGAARILPEFATTPAPELQPYIEMVGLKNFFEDHWSNSIEDSYDPIGAGLCIIREVANRYLLKDHSEPLRKNLDRRGMSLSCHGDTDIVWVGCRAGFGKGIFADLVVTHLIPSSRINLDYLVDLFEAHALSTVLLDAIHRPESLLNKHRTVLSRIAGWIRFLRLNRVQRRFAIARANGQKKARELIRQQIPSELSASTKFSPRTLIPMPPV